MIAIDTIRRKLATIAARLTAACPGAPRSCASASRAPAPRGRGSEPKTATARRGISTSVPTSISAIAI